MNPKYSQKGFTTTIYIVLILMAVVGAGGFVIYQEHQSLVKKLEQKEETIGKQKAAIESLEQANSRLSAENTTLTKQIDLLNDIAKKNDEERSKREKKLRDIENAFKKMKDSLPETLTDADVCKQTALEAKNSEIRINYIWNIFKIDNFSLEQVKSPLTLPNAK